MDNKTIARILRETAELLQIDGAIIGRYRSYEKAGELIGGMHESIEQMAQEGKLEELPGIGERMAEHIQEIIKTGDYSLRSKMLKKFPATLLEVLTLQSLGPKKVAFLWSNFRAATVADVEQLARDGKLRDVPGFGEKTEQNILKAVETFKRSTGRFRIDKAEAAAAELIAYILKFGKGIASITPAGSLRRGKETVGDLDLLLTLEDGHTSQTKIDAIADYILKCPRLEQTLAHGENKVSFNLDNGLQVDVRLLEKNNFGAALLYFTGSKEHKVRLRGRANDMGLTLNDMKGDLQMHTTASDGKNTIAEMAREAQRLGHEYIAITDHSKAVTVANGLDEKRAAEHIKNLKAVNEKTPGIRVLAGSEVDILKDGSLDYSDEILAQLEVVVCSIHSYFNLERAAMTERMLAAIENPFTQIIAHPTGRLLLRRDELDYDMEKILDACAKYGVAMECNSYPDRLDLKDVYLRMCKQRGVKVVISTDSHSASNLSYIRHGVTVARRGWLEPRDVINTLPTDQFLAALRPKPGTARNFAAKTRNKK